MGLTPDEAAQAFDFGSAAVSVRPQEGGHINASFRARTTTGAEFLLQRINSAVFPDCRAVMRNIEAVTDFIRQQPPDDVLACQQQIGLVPAASGGRWLDADGEIWRAFPVIPHAVVRTHAESPAHAASAGLAFGTFLRLLDQYDGPALAVTLPHFHDTGWYLARLAEVARADRARRAHAARPELAECHRLSWLADALPRTAPRRIVHNDAKLANVLLHAVTDAPLAVIDLDTVMEGSALADAGDLIRSLASPTREDEPDLARVHADATMIEAVLEGWFRGAGPVLTTAEQELAVLAGCVTTYEQAVRFLSDFLDGDHYYHVADPMQNLRRTRTQLRLLDSLLSQRDQIERRVMVLPLDGDS